MGPQPAEESQSLRPVESSAVPQDAIEKSPAAPLDPIGQKPPVAESAERTAAGKGRQRKESEEDEAALRLNLIESMKKSVAEKRSGSKELEDKKQASKETEEVLCKRT